MRINIGLSRSILLILSAMEHQLLGVVNISKNTIAPLKSHKGFRRIDAEQLLTWSYGILLKYVTTSLFLMTIRYKSLLYQIPGLFISKSSVNLDVK